MHVKFEIFWADIVDIPVFWNAIPFGLVAVLLYYARTFCIHVQGRCHSDKFRRQ